MMFKKFKDADDTVLVWEKMDEVVHYLRLKKAIKHWEKYGIPHITMTIRDGNKTEYSIINFQLNGENGLHKMTYDDFTTNPYWYGDYFKRDSWGRIEKVFNECLEMCK